MKLSQTFMKMVHKKCRSATYPFGNSKRISIPDEHVPWNVNITYDPSEYESPNIRNKPWADPHIGEYNNLFPWTWGMVFTNTLYLIRNLDREKYPRSNKTLSVQTPCLCFIQSKWKSFNSCR